MELRAPESRIGRCSRLQDSETRARNCRKRPKLSPYREAERSPCSLQQDIGNTCDHVFDSEILNQNPEDEKIYYGEELNPTQPIGKFPDWNNFHMAIYGRMKFVSSINESLPWSVEESESPRAIRSLCGRYSGTSSHLKLIFERSNWGTKFSEGPTALCIRHGGSFSPMPRCAVRIPRSWKTCLLTFCGARVAPSSLLTVTALVGLLWKKPEL